jgi:hypothetical protein
MASAACGQQTIRVALFPGNFGGRLREARRPGLDRTVWSLGAPCRRSGGPGSDESNFRCPEPPLGCIRAATQVAGTEGTRIVCEAHYKLSRQLQQHSFIGSVQQKDPLAKTPSKN